jgi:hypothetical protein
VGWSEREAQIQNSCCTADGQVIYFFALAGQEDDSFTPNFNNRITSLAGGYGINNNLITLLN